MSVKTDKVKSGYSELTSSERTEVKNWISEFDNATTEIQKNFSRRVNETFNKSAGPKMETNCPCCGR